jgi:DNA-directed RNA polymerase specialized sigma24 family protein
VRRKSFHEGNLRSWLFVILINLNRNRLRGLARRAPHTNLDQIDRAAAVPAPSGERHDILQALERLSDEVLLLVANEGLTYAECAPRPVYSDQNRDVAAVASLRPSIGETPNGNDQSHLRIIK